MKKSHPIYLLEKKLLKKEPRIVLEFSRYVYVSYGVTSSREIFHINGKELIDGWLEDQIEKLSEGQELALHSRVRLNPEDKNIYHIPMIDFINTKIKSDVTNKLSDFLKSFRFDLFLFESGNSFHGYFFSLLTENEWYKFLGKILLCNPPSRKGKEIVDSRWVGHSLEHGFSALRWSKKTEKYKIIPKLLNNRQDSSKLPLD